MPLTELDLRYYRENAVRAHGKWKSEILLCDAVANDEWSIMWPDLSVESSEPLVENLYAQALEDKTITAGAIPPMLFTQPTRGTRKDRGEKNAAKRKRVGKAYWERSDVRRNLKKFYRDWYHTGVMVGSPWATGFSGSNVEPPQDRFAFFQVLNPRHLFPLGWDNRGRLTAGLILRQKRITDLEADWGRTHPALVSAKVRAATRTDKLHWLEEIWYFDQTQWAVAIGDAGLPSTLQGVPFGPTDALGSMLVDWLVPPSEHNLGQCPLKAAARVTHNDSPRGALVDTIPQLKLAQNFMARLLDDLQASIYAPVLLDNVKNPDEYGLGAVLVGTGQGRAQIDRDRPPVNFEAQQTVRDIMSQVRRQAFEPAQRSGDPEASIVSAKGTVALMGTFNAELAAAQHDCEVTLADLTSVTAAFDEAWCAGSKQIHVADSSGEMEDEVYDPAELFKGDHRYSVSYGDRTGLDEQQHLTRLAMMRNLNSMSRRRFMEKSGMVEDALDEETEIVIETLVSLWTDAILPQQIQAGNQTALVDFVKKIDTDKMTAREAVIATIEAVRLASGDEGQGQGPGSPGGRADIIRMMRSLQSGGIPGNAEGQPPSQLDGPVRRQLANTAPGGGNAV